MSDIMLSGGQELAQNCSNAERFKLPGGTRLRSKMWDCISCLLREGIFLQ